MEGERFDSFARALGQSNSRRSFLKVLGAGIAGALFAGFAPTRAVEHAEANPTPTIPTYCPPGESRIQCAQQCPAWCQANLQGQAATVCTSLAIRGYGPCWTCGPAALQGHPDLCQGNCCPATSPTCCSSGCKNLQIDENNCGTCGHVCPGGQVCCGGACKDLSNDTNNCGSCGHVCPGPTSGTGAATCTSGNCGITCSGSTPNRCGTACVNVQTDKNHCGVCTTACLPTEQCIGGVCTDEPNGDPCGSNGECASGNCANGICCPTGQSNCGGTCSNTQTDNNNCGVCGTTCIGGTCLNGTCACPTGQKLCSGTCIPMLNCCTSADCTAPLTCQSGTCACPTPLCGGQCCGVVYGSTQICSGGRCCVPTGSGVRTPTGGCDSDSCCSTICELNTGLGLCVASL